MIAIVSRKTGLGIGDIEKTGLQKDGAQNQNSMADQHTTVQERIGSSNKKLFQKRGSSNTRIIPKQNYSEEMDKTSKNAEYGKQRENATNYTDITIRFHIPDNREQEVKK